MKKLPKGLAPSELRYQLDPASLPFTTTADLEPLTEILGQERGVEAFRFGMGMRKSGYNIFVTGAPRTGRLATIQKLLDELKREANGDRPQAVPDDLCYVNNFKHSESPILLRFPAGQGQAFKKAMAEFLESVKREVPQLFESEDYIQRKNAIAEAHEKQIMEFYKSVEEKVKDTGLAVVRMQMGPFTRPDVLPLVDGEPKRMLELEEMVGTGRFPAEEFERLKTVRAEVKEQVDHIVGEIRTLQKEMVKKHEEVDKAMLRTLAQELIKPLSEEFSGEKVQKYLESVLDNMVENLDALRQLGGKGREQQANPMMMMMQPSPEAILSPYEINLLVDNAEQSGPPVIVESFPTYRNLFGSIERLMDRGGGWRTDFTMIKAGSFVRANGGYLVVNLMDAIMEPGVWPTLKRSLRTEEIEIETYDPFYFISATGLKPESIAMNVKVVVYADPYLYQMLLAYDPDFAKIFKVKADFEYDMARTDEAVTQLARFIRAQCAEHGLKPFTADGVGQVVERAVRMAGRREKLTTALPMLSDLLAEADLMAERAGAGQVTGGHVDAALAAAKRRMGMIEDRMQEMIDRGSIFVDVTGEVVGQVNGLAVMGAGGYIFGKPSRITAVTAMGKEGIINIEREADLSGPTHNKGMLILSGYLRRTFAQDKPLSLAASIAFEQNYGGIDGDSASSTELYALLSSLAEIPLRQSVAVTGSVNQKGEVQPIGGVNEKIEGFYQTCKARGLTGDQGVLIPTANVADLMLDQEVVEAVKDKQFHIFAVATIAEGIEILTGVKAGTRNKSGSYTKGSVFAAADAKLKALAEGLRDWGKAGEEKKKKSSKKK